MNIFNHRRTFVLVGTITLSLLVGVASVQAWTGNPGPAPENNTPPPINTSGNLQNKSGTLGVGELLSVGEVVSSPLAGFIAQLRMVYGNFGAFFRNDGANTYLLFTNSGDQYGSWNGLRPFFANNTTGDVTMGYANNRMALRVKHGGNVGINLLGVATNPGSNLDIKQIAGADDNIRLIDDNTANYWGMSFNNSDLTWRYSGTDRMKLSAAGALTLPNLVNQPTYLNVLVSNAAGNIGFRTIEDIIGGGGTGGGSKWSDAAANPLAGIYYQGNVGVGTANLIRPLTVKGQVASVGDGSLDYNAGGVFLHDTNNKLGWFIGNRGTLLEGSRRNNFKITRCDNEDCTNDPANNMFEISRDGSVGIGVTLPGVKLDVGGDIRLRGNDTTHRRIFFQGAGATPVALSQLPLSYTGTDRGGLYTDGVLMLNGPVTMNMSAYIHDKLGIGVTPQIPLDVSGVSTVGIRYTKNAADARIQVKTPAQTWSLANGWGGSGDSYSLNAMSVIDETNGVVPLTITTKVSGSNVGIGTTVPSQRLDVAGGGVRFRNLPADTTNTEVLTISNLGVLGRRAISAIGGNTGYGLPSGTLNQTLRHDGTAWVASPRVLSDGSTLTIKPSSTSNRDIVLGGGFIAAEGLNLDRSSSLFVFKGGNPGLNKVLTSDANGVASWKTLTEIGGTTGTGSSLPAGTVIGQTLYWNGTAWVSASNLKNLNSSVLVTNDFRVEGITRLAGSSAIVDGSLAVFGNSILNGTVKLQGLSQDQTNNRLITSDLEGNLAWRNNSSMYIDAMFTKNTGTNSFFTKVTGIENDIDYQTVEKGGFWPWQWSSDYVLMACPVDYRVISGGVKCSGTDKRVKASYMPTPDRGNYGWLASCGNQLADIESATITCVKK